MFRRKAPGAYEVRGMNKSVCLKWIRGVCILFAVCVLFAVFINADQAKAEENNTYLLSVSTGESTGKNVQYIAVIYKDDNGKTRKHFLFPGEDSLSEGYARAAEKNKDELQKKLDNASIVMGFNITDYKSRKGLTQSYATDDFLFTPAYNLKEIEKIQICTFGNSQWSVPEMKLYRVSDIYGLNMLGGYSGQYYIDFSGTLIAEYASSRGTLSWTSSELFSIQPKGDSNGEFKLETGLNKAYSTHEVGKFGVEMSLADCYGAGIEALVSEFSSYQEIAKRSQLSSMGLMETLVLNVRYKDKSGIAHEVQVPMVANTILSALEQGTLKTDSQILGVAQQGEKLAFAVSFPNCEEIIDIHIAYGDVTNSIMPYVTQKNTSRVDALKIGTQNADNLSFTKLTICELDAQGTLKTSLNSGMLQSEIESGGDVKWYTVAESDRGIQLAPKSKAYSKITFLNEKDRTKEPVTKKTGTTYLVMVTTDEISSAGTADDVTVQLEYTNKEGKKECESDEVSLQNGESVKDFYGYWSGKEGGGNKATGMQRVLTAAGQTFCCPITIQNVEDLTGIKLSKKGKDDWQIYGIQIYDIQGALPAREGKWLSEQQKNGSYMTDRVYTRAIDDSNPLVRMSNLATLVKKNKFFSISQNGETVSISEKKYDWSNQRYSMDYETTQKDLGFTTDLCNYTVTVSVADDAVTDFDSGDCGSKGKFYFQLVFENGSSAYVLANQQLSADGFRAGYDESFKIATNRNYGELSAVKIIPDDMISNDSGTGVYDKLKVNQIRVLKDSENGTNREWIIDNIGWVNIPYVDEVGRNASFPNGRSESEICQTYPVSDASYSVKLDFEIANHNLVDGETPFQGQMYAKIVYIDDTGRTQYCSVDVVKAMYDYLEMSPSWTEKETSTSEIVQDATKDSKKMTVSNPAYMFQSGKVNHFYVNLSRAKTLKSIQFSGQSSLTCKWVVDNLSIFRVLRQGTLKMTDDNQYLHNDQKSLLGSAVLKNDELFDLWFPEASTQHTPVLDLDVDDIPVDFDTGNWTISVKRVPASQNDVLNIYAFTKDTKAAGYKVKSVVHYQCADGSVKQQNKEMRYEPLSAEGDNIKGMLTVKGLNVSGMVSLQNMTLKEMSTSTAAEEVAYAIVQQIRNNVIVNSYYLDFSGGNLTAKDGANRSPSYGKKLSTESQKVYLSLDEKTEEKILNAEKYDMVVGIDYKIKYDSSKTEYRSKYVYLTDQNIKKTKMGSYLVLNFDEKYVSEITGITLQPVGGLPVAIDAACVGTYEKKDGQQVCTGWYCFEPEDKSILDKLTTIKPISRQSEKKDNNCLNSADRLIPVHLSIKTAANEVLDTSTIGSGTKEPVSMTINYTKIGGAAAEKTYHNLTGRLQTGDFSAGNTADAYFLIQGIESIRWIEFAFADGTVETASWKPESVTAEILDPASDTIWSDTRPIGVTITKSNPGYANFGNISVEASINSDSTARTGEILAMGMTAGDSSEIAVKVNGSEKGFQASVNETNENGDVITNDSSSPESYMKVKSGGIVFNAPSDGIVNRYFVITVSSKEIPGAQLKIKITVSPKPVSTGSGDGDTPGGSGSDTPGGSDSNTPGESGSDTPGGNDNNTPGETGGDSPGTEKM